MNLFELDDNGTPIVAPIAYELRPFKKIIAEDRSINKSRAKAELAFVWFYCDYKSDFSSIIDENKKVSEITELLNLGAGWKITKRVTEAIDFYKEITVTPTVILLDQTKKTIHKLSEFLEGIDFNEEDNSGKPKYDMKKVVDTTTQIPKLIATLREIEAKVQEEQENIEKKIKGGKELEALETWN